MPKSVREATEALIELHTLPQLPNALLLSIVELIGCAGARVFEKNKQAIWNELGRVETSSSSDESYVSFDTRQCKVKVQKYPKQLLSSLIEEIDNNNKNNIHLFNNSSPAFALNADLFKKQGIKSIFLLSIQQDDGSTWIVYFSSPDSHFFHDYLDKNYLKLFASTIQNLFWRLCNQLSVQYSDYKDKSLFHDLRNSDQAKKGAVYLIKEHCEILAQKISTVENPKTKDDLKSELSEIQRVVHHLEGELEEEVDRIQTRLDGIKPNTTILPSPFRTRFKDSNESSASQQLISEFIKTIVNEHDSIARRYHKPIQLELDSDLEGVSCVGLYEPIKMIIHNLMNNAIQHGAADHNIQISLKKIISDVANEDEIDFEFVISNKKAPPQSIAFHRPVQRQLSGSHLGQHNIKDSAELLTRAGVSYEDLNDQYIARFSFALKKTEFFALIVEDSAINIKMLQRILEKKQIQSMVAETSLDAKNLIDEHHFDLIFIDGHLKDGSSGLELAKELRGGVKSHLIWMSGNALNGDDAFFFDKHLIKPFSQNDIFEAIEELLPLSAVREEGKSVEMSRI